MSAFLGEIGVQVSKVTRYGYTGWSDILNIWTSHDGFHTSNVCTIYWTKKDYVSVEVYGDSEDVGAFFELADPEIQDKIVFWIVENLKEYCKEHKCTKTLMD